MPAPFADPPSAADDNDFATLFAQAAQSGPRRTRFKPGDAVKGAITFIGEKTATLDLGDGQEGLLDLSGLRGKDGAVTIKVGEIVAGHVLRIRDRVVEVARQLGKTVANLQSLQEAMQSGLPVTGTITATNKGGYVIDLGHGAQGFCPHAMIDVRRVEDGSGLVGQKCQFKVVEVRDSKDVLLSRRAAMEMEQTRRAEETRQVLVVGAKLTGVVTNVRDFGAFVDLGGLEGLIPASELAYGRVKVHEVVQPGDKVDVQVQRIEPGLDHKGRPVERISLSMRALAPDPFALLQPDLVVGLILHGKVRRVEPFGAFVELIPGVEGLIHVGAFGRRIGVPGEVVLPEQKITVRVLAVDVAQRRISLSYVDPEKLALVLDTDVAVPATKTAASFVGMAKPDKRNVLGQAAVDGLFNAPGNPRQEKARLPAMGEVLDVMVDKVETFGVLVSFGHPGPLGRGMVPISEIGLAQGADLRRHLPVGHGFKAVVTDVRPDGRVRLSRSQAERAQEQAEASQWLSSQVQQAAKQGVGSFGELLLAKIGSAPKK